MKGHPEKQISFMKDLVAFCVKNNCNAEDIWSVFAACADIGAVKYFWPDPADEKVYLKAKQQMENNARKEEAETKKKARAMMGALLGDSNSSAEVAASFFSGTKMMPSAKTGPGALALGRNKKDNRIRFVESESFAAKIIAAALVNDRKDVVVYLLKQTGGTDADLRKAVAYQWMTEVSVDEYARVTISEKLSELAMAKKEADNKFDIPQIDKQIKALKRQLGGINSTVASADTLAAVFADMTPIEAAEYCYRGGNWIYRGDDLAEASKELLAARSKGTLEAGMAVVGSDAGVKMMRAMSGGGKARLSLDSVIRGLNAVCAKSTGELGKWYKWRTEFNKNWRVGIADKWLPSLVSGKKVGEWIYDARNGFPSLQYPGCLSKVKIEDIDLLSGPKTTLVWIWTPGVPDVSRPGYFAGKKEGTFVWKAGIPDPGRIGMITGAKEGEWVLAPGFQKQADGKVCWVAGLTDPARPGIVSTEKMFCWIPDEKHLWSRSEENNEEEMKRRGKPYLSTSDYDVLLEARNENLSALGDYQRLHPAVDKALSGGNRRY